MKFLGSRAISQVLLRTDCQTKLGRILARLQVGGVDVNDSDAMTANINYSDPLIDYSDPLIALIGGRDEVESAQAYAWAGNYKARCLRSRAASVSSISRAK